MTSEQPYAYALRHDGRRIILTDGAGETPGSLRIRTGLPGTFEMAARWEVEHMYYTTADGEQCPVRWFSPEARP